MSKIGEEIARALSIAVIAFSISWALRGCYVSLNETDMTTIVEKEKTKQMRIQWKIDSLRSTK